MAWAPKSLGCNHGGGVVLLHFMLRDTMGPPHHIEPTGIFLDFGSDRLGHPFEAALCNGSDGSESQVSTRLGRKCGCRSRWRRTTKVWLWGGYERGRALHLDERYPGCP